MKLDDYKPSPPAEVECTSESGRTTLVFIRQLRHPPEKVWQAMTQAAKIAKWAPYEPSRDLDALGAVTLRMTDGSTPELYESEVLEIEEGKLVVYSWGSENTLRWELEGEARGTRLTLRHTVDDERWITPSAAGWHMCLDIAELQMDGHSIGPILAEAAMDYGWEELAVHYGEVLNRPWKSSS